MMEEKKTKETYEKVGAGTYKNSSGDCGLFMGGFPQHLAQEWETDCKTQFKGVRWMKAWTDWKTAQALIPQVQLFQLEINRLQEELGFAVEELQKGKTEKKPEEVLTIGNGE